MSYIYIYDPNKNKSIPAGFYRTAKGITNSARAAHLFNKQLRNAIKNIGQRKCSSTLDLIILTNGHMLKSHPYYFDAKHGNYFAAKRLVKDVIKDDKLKEIDSFISQNDIFLPVMHEHSAHGNKIPWALAKLLEQKTSGRINCSIHKISQFKHTGKCAIERILTPEIFVGSVKRNGQYILIDDHTTSGGTFASLASYIEANQGIVKGLISISTSAKISQSDGFISLAPQEIAS